MDEASVLLYLFVNTQRLIRRAESLDVPRPFAPRGWIIDWRKLTFHNGRCTLAVSVDEKVFARATVIDNLQGQGLVKATERWGVYVLTHAGRCRAEELSRHWP